MTHNTPGPPPNYEQLLSRAVHPLLFTAAMFGMTRDAAYRRYKSGAFPVQPVPWSMSRRPEFRTTDICAALGLPAPTSTEAITALLGWQREQRRIAEADGWEAQYAAAEAERLAYLNDDAELPDTMQPHPTGPAGTPTSSRSAPKRRRVKAKAES